MTRDPPPSHSAPHRSTREEYLNAFTHGIGALASGIAAIPLYQSVPRNEHWPIVASVLIYCLALVGVYFVSTLSHAVHRLSLRRRLRKWDQGLIYLLIVATYTPFALIFLSGYWHLLTTAMWLLALFGFWSKVALEHRIDRIAVALYMLVGWLPILTIPQFLALAPPSVVWLMVAGGMVYSAGVALLLLDRRWPYLHTVWHVFVLVASGLHYWGITLSLRTISAN